MGRVVVIAMLHIPLIRLGFSEADGGASFSLLEVEQ
jgi:hypothetical protein